MNHLVAPSVLAADFANLQRDIEMIDRSSAEWVHCDIMDGRFVPNISFGLPVLKAMKKHTQKPLDVHLMIVQPDQYIQHFKDAGADHLTVHAEACTHLDRTLHAIREAGMKAGIALNPHTPVQSIKHVLHLADIVLLMSVNPGFGGQSFIPYVLDKVAELKGMILEQGTSTLIEIDGGVNLDTGMQLLKAGADVLVAGSFVFKSADPIATIASLKALDPTQAAV
ncbi:ribulose-phosphate 3-epimerase [Pontibacter sp. G13]|uniref:ribulose-phosphate 3-epimerase n=1 Tax=Pontibacter sp. G13 TaxID=3074898 RepID=UPI00288A1A77|nr:ribulose-phosphate 3-epimerase [Pontibacter sp. G13]WNJ18100.1 ribulose-phosphate 3-epimerase [Pontibacter sp. G13]